MTGTKPEAGKATPPPRKSPPGPSDKRRTGTATHRRKCRSRKRRNFPGQRPGKPARPGFQHNPNSGNDRDDLI